VCADSRTDSLAKLLQRKGIFDEYFTWCLSQRPSFAERKEWLEEHGCAPTNGSLSRLHKSPEASIWRYAEGQKAREIMDKNLPKDLDVTLRKALLDARAQEVQGELTHQELMDHLMVENATAKLELQKRTLALKEKTEPQKLKLAERKVALLEKKAAEALATVNNSSLSAQEQAARIREIFKKK
jgi:hypothetical protein